VIDFQQKIGKRFLNLIICFIGAKKKNDRKSKDHNPREETSGLELVVSGQVGE
jgi:hypothetical protein